MIGTRQKFEYHCWQDEQSSDAELWHHTNQFCLILSELDLSEDDREAIGGTMYHVRFDDGFESDVFEDEII